MDGIILYSTQACPRCGILKKRLAEAGIVYEVCDDVDVMVQKGILSVPQLEIGEKRLDFASAMAWAKGAL